MSKYDRILNRVYELCKQWLRGTISMEIAIQRITYLMFLYKLNGNGNSLSVIGEEEEEIEEAEND